MVSLSANQKQILTEFIGCTCSSEKVAIKCLKGANWQLAVAIERFFDQDDSSSSLSKSSSLNSSSNSLNSKQSSKSNLNKINQFFDSYKDSADTIGVEGTEKLCHDLKVDPSDVVMLVIAWKMGCKKMCEFKRPEWISGCRELNVDGIESLRTLLPKLRSELLENQDTFKQVYLYTFSFARDENQKSLPPEIATVLWKLLLSPVGYKLLDDWCNYVNNTYKKAISKDTWNLFLDFVRTVPVDLSSYDAAGAWPILMDEFVTWKRSTMQQDENDVNMDA